MTRLIKFGEETNGVEVTVFGSVPAQVVQPEPVHVKEPEWDPEIRQLREENARLREALAELREVTEEAVETAIEQGRADAIASLEANHDAALELLGSSLASAQEALSDRLSSWDALSVAIARNAMSKILRTSSEDEELIRRLIGRQIDLLKRDSIVRIIVSKADFEDEDTITQLKAELGIEAVLVTLDDQLGRGQCMIDLRLGKIEISLDHQWEKLVSVFDEVLAEGGRE